MFYKDEMVDDYFCWLVSIISDGRENSYSMLLKQLFDTSFVYVLERDANRAHDGLDLRDRYSCEEDICLDISSPCSVLEMMIALSIRCETDVMYNPSRGDRTYIWFWEMIENLGLIRMNNNNFNVIRVRNVLNTFMDRQYETDGKGGLFWVPGSRGMENEEIWYQMNTFLNSIIN